MTERENLLEVINHSGKARWLPIVGDGIVFANSSVVRDRPPVPEDGYDWFGCYWVYDKMTGGYTQPPESRYPVVVEDITEWKNHVVFPDLDAIDWAGAAQRDLENFDREKLLLLNTESGVFERLYQMCGFENAFISMYEEPEAFEELMGAITEFRVRFYDKLITYYKPDILLVMDDLGGSNGPLFSLEMYRRLIKPYDKKVIEYIHSRGVMVMYHSCGCMEDFVDDILDMGAEMLHSLQGGVNNQEQFQIKYGERLVVMGGLHNLVHMPDTGEAELRREIRRLMSLFWEKKNLLVLPRSCIPGKTEILMDEARKYNAAMAEANNNS